MFLFVYLWGHVPSPLSHSFRLACRKNTSVHPRVFVSQQLSVDRGPVLGPSFCDLPRRPSPGRPAGPRPRAPGCPGPWPLAPGPRPLGPRPPAPRPPARRRPPFFSGVGYACTFSSLDQQWLSLRCRLLQLFRFSQRKRKPEATLLPPSWNNTHAHVGVCSCSCEGDRAVVNLN